MLIPIVCIISHLISEFKVVLGEITAWSFHKCLRLESVTTLKNVSELSLYSRSVLSKVLLSTVVV
jgi:hypothetical protein